VLPIDPTADRGRRAWLPCPGGDHGAQCGDCRSTKNCAEHWQYLLSNEGTLVHLQCKDCGHLWSTDTRGPAARRSNAA
jgi:transcription initiation factor TFIIS-like protein